MAAQPKPDPTVDFAKATHAARPRAVQHLANLGAFNNMAYTVSEPLSMSYSAGDLTR